MENPFLRSLVCALILTADKWAEAIGQALHYAAMTGKKRGIVLIMEKETDERYLKRLRTVTDGVAIKVWVSK